MRIAAIIVAAGRGERAGRHPDGPKQYRRLGDRTVLGHTLETFRRLDGLSPLVVVHHPDDRDRAAEAVFGTCAILVEGGATRQASVLRGLETLAAQAEAPDAVLVHDAVRPFAEAALVARVMEALLRTEGAIPALPVADTLKRGADGQVVETVDRVGLHAAQTPQGFRFAALLDAHRRAADAGDREFTDDASIAEWAGLTVALVPGARTNVKLTTAEDLKEAERTMAPRPTIDVRSGTGYDVHRLVPGESVTLCGVEIPHSARLDGHSDADVCLHALTDALLATCGAGDIGDHFPPSDPQWRGAASHIFVEHAVSLVTRKGGRILNADVTLICEAPKIAPHREHMRARIGAMTGLSAERVSVKATTNEGIGFVGREEGIASIVTVSVSYGD